MRKHKRLFAGIGAILLLLLYVSTIIFAFMDSPLATKLLAISVAATILLPVIFYAVMLVYRIMNRNDNDNN